MHSGTEEPQTGLQAAREAKVAMLKRKITSGNFRTTPRMLKVVVARLMKELKLDGPSEESRRVEFDRVNDPERFERI